MLTTLSSSFLSFSTSSPSLSQSHSNPNISSTYPPSQPRIRIPAPPLITASSAQATRSEPKSRRFSPSSPPPSMAMTSSSFTTTNITLYDTLGIASTASCHEIKAAYRRLARACHPDVVSVGQKDSSALQFMKIHSAYLTLSDPAKRAGYDRELFVTRRPRTGSYSGVGSGSGFTACRNWETDQCW